LAQYLRRRQDNLADMGCDAVQGFAIARPLPPERVGEWLGSHGVQAHKVRSAPD
jgi:EAL domain-containing protein (putative c-di-GMP-specific phosphodiesterase class I)